MLGMIEKWFFNLGLASLRDDTKAQFAFNFRCGRKKITGGILLEKKEKSVVADHRLQ